MSQMLVRKSAYVDLLHKQIYRNYNIYSWQQEEKGLEEIRAIIKTRKCYEIL